MNQTDTMGMKHITVVPVNFTSNSEESDKTEENCE